LQTQSGVEYNEDQLNHTSPEKEGAQVEKKPYEAPKVFELGTVKELTESTGELDKCSGSGDTHTLIQESPNYDDDCPDD
jgi:hypothetical protein